MARAFAERLKAEHSLLIVAQSILPHLWREGHLGGRSFDVMMSRFPLAELHCRLHREIAARAGAKAQLVDWSLPPAVERRRQNKPRLRIAFPGSTLCRKGAYELRQALCGRDVELLLLGGGLEGADFWGDVNLVLPVPDWLSEVDAVVLPAFVEHRPRSLLRAVTSGVPVIATAACGVEGLPGVTTVPAGDAAALRAALEHLDEGSIGIRQELTAPAA
ncbi:MAG TPA: glycosyltransferase [Prosthecobacter sp.]|nr:glycosyltransferase [Prosthecobacter sp.]